MGMTIGWDTEDPTILFYTVEDPWEWDDLHRLVDEVFQVMDSVNKPLDVIALVNTSVTFKAGMLAEGRKILSRRHPNAGLTVVVTTNVLFRSVLTMLRLAYPRIYLYTAFQYASSIEAARELIQHQRKS